MIDAAPTVRSLSQRLFEPKSIDEPALLPKIATYVASQRNYPTTGCQEDTRIRAAACATLRTLNAGSAWGNCVPTKTAVCDARTNSSARIR